MSYIFRKTLIQESEKCVFCDKERININNEDEWHSSFVIFNINRFSVTSMGSVCPECRKKHTVQELYAAQIEKQLRELEKVIER